MVRIIYVSLSVIYTHFVVGDWLRKNSGMRRSCGAGYDVDGSFSRFLFVQYFSIRASKIRNRLQSCDTVNAKFVHLLFYETIWLPMYAINNNNKKHCDSK